MTNFIVWPNCVLRAQTIAVNAVPFNRSGGKSLGGTERVVTTSLGYWTVDYGNILLRQNSRDSWKTLNALRTILKGRAGLVAVQAAAPRSAPYVSGQFEPVSNVHHSDGTGFSDGTAYTQGAISVVSVGYTPVGATTIRLRIINAAPNLSGVRFSYRHALYETGQVIDIDGDVWTVHVSPSVRAPIPDGSDLEFDRPTVLCHLADDRSLDFSQSFLPASDRISVSFVEATDYWSNLATGSIA